MNNIGSAMVTTDGILCLRKLIYVAIASYVPVAQFIRSKL